MTFRFFATASAVAVAASFALGVEADVAALFDHQQEIPPVSRNEK